MPDRPIRDSQVSFIAATANITRRAVVRLTAANTVDLPAAASADPLGVALDAQATANKEVPILMEGIAQCIAAAAITAGDYVEVADATGKVRTKAKAIAGAQPTPIVGRALTAAAVSGDFVDVVLMIGGMY